MKKLVAFLLAAMMCVTALTACGGSGGSSDSGSSSGSGEKAKSITVNIWDSNQQKGIQEIADKWTETSGVKVNVEVVDWDNYWTLLEAGASGGTMPDVFWMHSNTAQMYMENDILLKLNDYIDKDSSIDMSKYYEGVKDLYTRSDGNIYALPKDHDTIALLYNKAIFDKYGVQYPTDKWTWEDMYAAAKKISEDSKGDVYGIAMNTSNNQDGWYNLIYGYGGQVITDDHKGTTIGSDKAKAGMEMTRKLLTVGAPQSVVAETGTDSLFMSNKVGMITQGSWMINAFYTAESHADYAWALLPYADLNGNGTCEKEERWSAYNGLGWAASAKTKDPDSCYSLIAYFCGEEGQKLQAEKGVTMGGMKGVSDAFASAFSGMDVSPFLKAEEYSLYFRPYTRKTTVWEDALQQAGAFLDPWQKPDDAELMSKACDNAQKIIEEAIANE
ncbi:ABC transporter substrate-binding protein [Ruminococcus sp.]|uniref:ABC transporter substrate-binding protein n=1 Tax=Ruminococcus sp. TaxID=41978 RepID=UPI00386842E8